MNAGKIFATIQKIYQILQPPETPWYESMIQHPKWMQPEATRPSLRRDPVKVPNSGLTQLTAEEARRVVGMEYVGNTTTTSLEHLSMDVDEIIDAKNFKRYQMEEQILRKTGPNSGNWMNGNKPNAYVVLDESRKSLVGSGLVSESNIALYTMPKGAHSVFEPNYDLI